MQTPAPRRWVVFTRSVISSIGNPDAHLYRAMASALAARGADAVFFEERANPAVVALMRARGGRALAEFRAAHPALHYRTMQPRGGLELAEWLGSVLATADIALVQYDVPAELARAVGALTRPHLQTHLVDAGLGAALRLPELAARRSAAFSGVLVGRADLGVYTAEVPPQRLHRFGPLEPACTDDEPPPSLPSAAERLVDLIARLSVAARTDGLRPDGRTGVSAGRDR